MATISEIHESNENYWAAVAVHEAAHGVVAGALGCLPIHLELFRSVRVHIQIPGPKVRLAGVCRSRFPRTAFGMFTNIMVWTAPMVAHEVIEHGDPDDLHERADACLEFRRVTGHSDNDLFRTFVDAPLMAFFRDERVKRAVLEGLAGPLYHRLKYRVTPKAMEELGIDQSAAKLRRAVQVLADMWPNARQKA